MTADWFESWFDSKYYHILYKDRDNSEAELFITKICKELQIKAPQKVLDLACGKGRHALCLHQIGLDVTGIDLSFNSIEEARRHQTSKLFFDVHDMRKTYKPNYFDAVFSIFTSMGYFEDEGDDLNLLRAANHNLKQHGLLVIDYFNSKKVLNSLTSNEEKTIENIDFSINKKIENNRVIKTISINESGKEVCYQERVMLYDLQNFKTLLTKASFEILSTFGDYDLGDFMEPTSDRLIIVARKLN